MVLIFLFIFSASLHFFAFIAVSARRATAFFNSTRSVRLHKAPCYWRSLRMYCGVVLAAARTETPACVRICDLVRLLVSAAKLASVMLLSLLVTFPVRYSSC